jgi:hypothetical protein
MEKYIEEQSACIAEAVRVLHPNGSICWQVGNHVQNGEIFPLDIVLYQLFKIIASNYVIASSGHLGTDCTVRSVFQAVTRRSYGSLNQTTTRSTWIPSVSLQVS